MANRNKNINKYTLGKNAHKHNKNKKFKCKALYDKAESNENYKKIDPVHKSMSCKTNAPLYEAKKCIKKAILKKDNEIIGITFIHGSKGGTAISDWIRNGPLQDFLNTKNIKSRIWYRNDSETNIGFIF